MIKISYTPPAKLSNEEQDKLDEQNFQTWVRWGKTVAGIVIVLMATLFIFAWIAPDYSGPWLSVTMLLAVAVGWAGEILTRPSKEENNAVS